MTIGFLAIKLIVAAGVIFLTVSQAFSILLAISLTYIKEYYERS